MKENKITKNMIQITNNAIIFLASIIFLYNL